MSSIIRSGQNHLARHSERRQKTRQTEEEVGRQHQGMNRPGVRQVLESRGERGKMEETGCEDTYGAKMTTAVKGQVKVKEEVFYSVHGVKEVKMVTWK